MRRGFKAEAERTSFAAREALGLGRFDRIDPWSYARHLEIVVIDFEELDLAESDVQQLTANDPDSWSGMTLKEGEALAVVLNPRHPRTRQTNTLMHELAHAILRHVPARVDVSATGVLLLSDYSDDQEDEADWLAASILMPRDALWFHRSSGRSVAEVADLYGVSTALCEWRIRMTGVDTQLRRSKRY